MMNRSNTSVKDSMYVEMDPAASIMLAKCWRGKRIILPIVVILVLTVLIYGYKHLPLSHTNIQTDYSLSSDGMVTSLHGKDTSSNAKDTSSHGKDTSSNGKNTSKVKYVFEGINKGLSSSSSQVKHINASLTDISAQEIDVARRWPRKVLFIWCGNDDFTFMHYVSARSVILQTKPSKVIFAYKTLPLVKPTAYNSWFSEFKASVVFWKEQQFENICASKHPSANDVETVATDIGFPVLFVSTSTFFRTPFLVSGPLESVDAYNASSGSGYHFLAHMNTSTTIARKNTFQQLCPLLNDIRGNRATSQKQCFSFGRNVRFYPEEVMYLATPAAAEIRRVFYGSEDLPYPAQDNNTSAPKIAHYVWVGPKPVPFKLYMSALSALFVAGLDKVCIHVDRAPYGEHWQRLQQVVAPDRIVVIPREKLELVYGQVIKPMEHKADVIKSSIMYEYGGIMMDSDIMFTQKLPTHFFHYDAVLSLGLDRVDHPDIINMGLTISKPRSEIARLWLDSEREFIDKDWNWNVGRITYKMWERNPTLAKLEPRLQMVCFQNNRCIPFWTKDEAYKHYKTVRADYMNTEEKITGTYSLHLLTDPFLSLDQVTNKDKEISGLVGRMILRAARVIKPNEGLVP